MSKTEYTRLGRFMKAHRIQPRDYKHLKTPPCSRQHLLRLRLGEAEPTRAQMVKIARATGRILGRHVSIAELFDIGERP